MKLLGVEREVFKKPVIDQEEIAYQMALGALENSGADIVVSNCGDLENGELTFAIGSHEGIHIFNQMGEGTTEQKIKELFASAKVPEGAPRRVYYPVSDYTQPVIAFTKDKEMPYVMLKTATKVYTSLIKKLKEQPNKKLIWQVMQYFFNL